MPDVPVALVTLPEFFRTDPAVTDWVELRQTRRGPIVKTDAWHAPYERVVLLDTDMLILGDLTDVLPLLDKFDLICAVEPNARPDHGIESGVPPAFPEPNNAFFAFRKTEGVQRFFETWQAEWDRLQQVRGITANQPAFRIALWKSDAIRHLSIGNEYNLIIHANCGVSGPVKILHDRSTDRGWMAGIVNRHIGPRAVVAGFGPVFGYFTRRGWIRQYLRLSWHFLRVLFRPGMVKQQGHPAIWWRDGVD